MEVLLLSMAGILPATTCTSAPEKPPVAIFGVKGNYDSELREATPRTDGIRHVDTPALVRWLKDLGVNTYAYLAWHSPSDWEDLKQEFLPAAQKARIDVWVYLTPSSEPPAPKPYGLDYLMWARAIGRLAARYPNLKGLAIDDFTVAGNEEFTPAYLRRMKEAMRDEGKAVAIVPGLYAHDLTESFINRNRDAIDGVIFPFCNSPDVDTATVSTLPGQLERFSALLDHGRGPRIPLVLMVYARRLASQPEPPSAAYVRDAVKIDLDAMAKGQIDGVMTYCLPKTLEPEGKDEAASGRWYVQANRCAGKALQNARQDGQAPVIGLRVRDPAEGDAGTMQVRWDQVELESSESTLVNGDFETTDGWVSSSSG